MTVRPRRLAVILIGSFLSSSAVGADDVLIFAAASTALALEEGILRYGKTATDRVRASYASSGALARQLDNGAPASLYLSANRKWLDWVEKKGLLAVGTRMDLLRNRLVLVQPGSVISTLMERDLKGWLGQVRGHRLAIADPMHAPAGDYAKEALTSLGLWKSLSRRTVRTQNVRAALLLVERQEAPYGIIYRTDARASKAVRILADFPEDSHKPILYGLAIIRNKDNEASRRFYNYLMSPDAQKIFRRFGFLTP
jgi:molybdate transport system substrate-binding protein